MQLTIKNKIYFLCGLSVLAGLVTTAYLIHRATLSNDESAAFTKEQIQKMNSARLVQVTFKKQVQSWKDILVRGHDPQSLRTQREDFFKYEAEVKAYGSDLESKLVIVDNSDLLKRFLESHQELGNEYRAALSAFEASGGVDFKAADRAVKGKDRVPTDLIDQLADKLNETATMLLDQRSRDLATQRNILLVIGCGVWGLICVGTVLLARSIIRPLLNMKEALSAVARGDLSRRVDDQRQDEIGQMGKALNHCTDTLNTMHAEIIKMNAAQKAGDIEAYAPEEKFEGAYKEIVSCASEGIRIHVNNILKILTTITAYAEGDLSPVLEKLPGKQAIANEKMDLLRKNLLGVINEMTRMAEGQKAGDIDAYVPEEKFTGAYRQIAAGINGSVRLIVNNVLKILTTITAYAEGNFSPVLEKLPGKQTIANEKMDLLRNNLQRLSKEVNELTDAALEGNLTARGKAETFAGDWQKLVRGINGTLDAMARPLSEINKVLQRIAVNDHTSKVEGSYQGTFAEAAMATNLARERFISAQQICLHIAKGDFANDLEVAKKEGKCSENDKFIPALVRMMETIQTFIAEMTHMSEQHNLGDTDVVMPEDKFEGAYRTMAKGVNDMIKGHITETKKAMACVADFSKGNLEAELERFPGKKAFINENIERLRTAVKALIMDASMLVRAAVEGKLATRADASKHQGDFRKIVQGVNDTLDAVIGPLNMAAKCVEDISKGAIPARITDTYNGDFNTLKNNLNVCIDAVNALVADARMLAQAAADGELATRADASKHHGDFRKVVDGVNNTLDTVIAPLKAAAETATTLASASEELSAVSHQMSATAEETATQSNVVSAAAEQVTHNLQTVATATEEMTASIKEIAKNANESARVATSAVRTAETTNATVTKLGDSSAQIGKVIKVITSIAQQTNLLALNATIEAARAGEAGKGFAVVANEVKELAKETAKATEDISQKIEAIQTDSKGAVEAIANISGVINQINDISNSIASAVEEQTATTNEIARNVQEAAKGAEQVNENIVSVAQTAKSTTQGANDTQTAAGELSRMAAELQKVVSRFRFDSGTGRGPADFRLPAKEARDALLSSQANTQQGTTARLQ